MIQTQFTKPMKHPELPDAPPERVEVVDYWRKDGRSIGLILDFPDKRRHLKFDEIRKLQAVIEGVVT